MENNQDKLKKILFVLGNVLLVFICLVVIFLILKHKNTVYEKEHELLYKVLNETKESDKYKAYKGDVANNYINYNNLLWRIVRINSSGSIMLVLDDNINMLPWQLNDEFIMDDYLKKMESELDKSKLTQNSICSDIINDLNNPTCKNVDQNYVSLLDLNSYVETIDNGKSFIGNDKEMIWLANEFDEFNAWHINSEKISHSKKDSLYGIRPVVTLNNEVLFESGKGTKEDPYLITSDMSIGSTVKLADDLYQVVSTNDNIKLVLKENLEKKYQFNGDYQEMLAYLKSNFYDKLTYKDIVLETEWEVINIKNNKKTSQKIKGYVGTLNLYDYKLGDSKDYYLLSKIDSNYMVYDNPIVYGTKKVKHSLRPCIVISKDKVKDLKLENGIYVLRDL